MKSRKIIIVCLIVVTSLSIGGFLLLYSNIFDNNAESTSAYKTAEENDKHVRFSMEIYDKILINYWNKGQDGDLAELYRLGVEKIKSTPQILSTKDRNGAAKLIFNSIYALDESSKKKFVQDLAVIVLYNLAPQGRNGLLTSGQETELRNNVSNIDPSKDLYKDLGLMKGASVDQINSSFEFKKNELLASTSTEAKDLLKSITYAKEVLLDQNKKELYDQAGIEPTVFSKKLSSRAYYVNIIKISPTTLSEFGKIILDTASSTSLNSLIIDVRGNIGGAVDFLQYFLGLFIGQGQYAFDFFHQNEYTPYKTMMAQMPELEKFRKVVLLTDNMTQSTAELAAAAFKRYNIGTVVGKTTRGWGTIENTYPIDTEIASGEKYSLLLVNSLTLRDDNQPIEGKGVDPDVDIGDKKWKSKLSEMFDSNEFVLTVIDTVSKQPIR